MGNFLSDTCPYSSTKPPFKACSPTLLSIYGGIFYPKGSDFSTKPFSQNSQRPFGKPLSPARNNSSRGKSTRKYLVQVFQFWSIFTFLRLNIPATRYPSYLNLCEFGCLEIWWRVENQTFHGKSAFSTHAENFGKYLKHFTRHLWTCKICTFVIVRYRGGR